MFENNYPKGCGTSADPFCLVLPYTNTLSTRARFNRPPSPQKGARCTTGGWKEAYLGANFACSPGLSVGCYIALMTLMTREHWRPVDSNNRRRRRKCSIELRLWAMRHDDDVDVKGIHAQEEGFVIGCVMLVRFALN